MRATRVALPLDLEAERYLERIVKRYAFRRKVGTVPAIDLMKYGERLATKSAAK